MRVNKRHTLLFDGNYFFYKTMYTIPRTDKSKKILETESDKVMFMQKLAMDFAAEIRRFKEISGRVVFVIDSSSWRKDFYPTKDYKGNRVPDDNVKWETFYACIKEFKEILESNGVVVQQVPGAEGDDLVYAWSKYLNLKEENVIIISGDGDLMQLIDYNESTKAYTIFYTNTRKKLAAYPGFIKWLKDDSNPDVTNIFEMKQTIFGNSFTKKLFNDLIKSKKLEMISIDSNEFLFKKVLMGDRGDNVESVYRYQAGSRTYRVSEKKADLVYAAFLEKHKKFKSIYLFDKSYREEITRILIHVLNATKMPYREILQNMEDNVMLMLLHRRSIPEEIQQQMFKEIEVLYKKEIPNIKTLCNRDYILEDTRYKEAKVVPNSMDPFRNEKVDDISINDIIGNNKLF